MSTIIYINLDRFKFVIIKPYNLRLLNLSKFQQVLLVTHLPQVAARGDKHYKTSKFVDEGITYTGIKELTIEDRVEEIAKMISGNTVTQEALMLSNKLLKN